jgi:hypothetical protein
MVLVALEVFVGYQLKCMYLNASVNGQLGDTSTGSINLSVVKTAAVNISGMKDMLVRRQPGSNDINWIDDICVYSSNGLGAYTLKISGPIGRSGNLVMTNGGAELPYTLKWNDGGYGNLSNDGVSLSPNITSPLFQRASTDNPSCNGPHGGSTARLFVNISRENLASVSEGSYSATLTLLISAI